MRRMGRMGCGQQGSSWGACSTMGVGDPLREAAGWRRD